MRFGRLILASCLALTLSVPAAADAARRDAPGRPGKSTEFAPANKVGFGTSHTLESKVWFTLGAGKLTEVFYPDLGTPAVRDLELIVTNGRGFTDRERADMRQEATLTDPRSLTYRQVNTDRQGRYRITKTYVTDPARAALLTDVRFEVLRGGPLKLYVRYDPALSNGGGDDRGSRAGRTLIARDKRAASALRAQPAFRRLSSGYAGTRSDGWRDLRRDGRLDRRFRRARKGNVVQTARTALNGTSRQRMTLALGFGRNPKGARRTVRSALATGHEAAAREYAAGWDRYLDSLDAAPRSVSAPDLRRLYDASLMQLAAHEDKTFRGASIASPSMPWAWGDGSIEKPSGAYHLVWSRDLYQVATAQLAAGDRPAAERLLSYLFERQQKRDGSFPQNSVVDGTEHWEKMQMDQVSFPIVLAWQLGRFDNGSWQLHVKPAAEFIMRTGPQTEQERWENQSGFSPASIAAQIAGLVCAADIALRNGDTEAAGRYLRKADEWRSAVERWTATSTGPYSPRPYYLRVAKGGQPQRQINYAIGDSGPGKMDHRRVVDPSFLELVRLGIKPASDQTVRNSLAVVDQQLKVDTPHGAFWHRFSFDGYGETRSGGPWKIGKDDTFKTFGRAWPIFAGERGEYDLAAGASGAEELRAMAGSANDGLLIPEQVWDGRRPTGRSHPLGEGTLAATPLAWSHAQFVRLALSIDARRPIETPSVVACRYRVRCP